MAGIYVHIPFCKQACHYCDFHFSTSKNLYHDLLEALLKEIVSRANELTEPISTIYFGGGTPSILETQDLGNIIQTIKSYYACESHIELTLECNPDDVSEQTLSAWRHAGVNRLSLGIQSFDDAVLSWMNRAHNANIGVEAFELARAAGFDNISCDLIYGIPDKDQSYWQDQLEQMLALKPEHLSCYCLTIEPKTALNHQLKQGLFSLPDQEHTGDEFLIMRDHLKQAGYEQYEVSNFALPEKASQHNSSYWKSHLYLGFGPSAHSFNGKTRRWNVSNNARYIKAIVNGDMYWDTEDLSLNEQYNEYVMTGLRTIWGVNTQRISDFGDRFSEHFEREISNYKKYLVQKEDNVVRLNESGLLIADKIASDLFIVD